MINRLISWGEWKRTGNPALSADAKTIERVFKSLDPFDRLVITNKYVSPVNFRRIGADQLAELEAAIIQDMSGRLALPLTGKCRVLELISTGLSDAKIASEAGCSRQYVWRIRQAIRQTSGSATQGR